MYTPPQSATVTVRFIRPLTSVPNRLPPQPPPRHVTARLFRGVLQTPYLAEPFLLTPTYESDNIATQRNVKHRKRNATQRNFGGNNSELQRRQTTNHRRRTTPVGDVVVTANTTTTTATTTTTTNDNDTQQTATVDRRRQRAVDDGVIHLS